MLVAFFLLLIFISTAYTLVDFSLHWQSKDARAQPIKLHDNALTFSYCYVATYRCVYLSIKRHCLAHTQVATRREDEKKNTTISANPQQHSVQRQKSEMEKIKQIVCMFVEWPMLKTTMRKMRVRCVCGR